MSKTTARALRALTIQQSAQIAASGHISRTQRIAQLRAAQKAQAIAENELTITKTAFEHRCKELVSKLENAEIKIQQLEAKLATAEEAA